ncbi:unnamed protein product [Diatraea saccharalis]|uniref:Leucine-rich repeat-containing protein 56 n=1 Tax=Diatraea saccharalis TaxID=40085 RepID=A0A9N9R7X7_9NEOP|nr:unnamed protein product [Diatraea saccharalis]
MPAYEAPSVELGSVPQTPTIVESPSLSEISSASSPEPQNVRATPLFRALAMPPPDPEQPPGQDELERRLPGYRRIVIPRELTLIELLKQSSGVTTDEEVLRIREAKLRVVAERVGLRRLHVLAPLLRSLTLDGSALSSLRDLGIGLVHLKVLSVNRCGLTCLDGVWGLGALCEFYAAGNRLNDLQPLAALQKLHTLNLSDNPIADTNRIWTLGVCGSLRRLTLLRTPAADSAHYHEWDQALGSYNSNSEESDEEVAQLMRPTGDTPPAEPEPGPSTQFPTLKTSNEEVKGGGDGAGQPLLAAVRRSRRPATTEGAGSRPSKPNIPVRPRTAHDRPTIDAPSRLQILNTLMELDVEKELVQQAMEDAARALAEEIPRAPSLEDWARFREETGIDINIDFNRRPRDADPAEVMDRLERIEKETMERLKQEESERQSGHSPQTSTYSSEMRLPLSGHDLWRGTSFDRMPELTVDDDQLFNDMFRINPAHMSILRHNSESHKY